MEELLNQFNANSEATFSLINYLLNIAICSVLLFILSFVYVRYGKSISNRSQLSKVLIVVGLTTFIIISIVKSSLALSLGLVGALSIVRFRTAIKEPEELGYFFIAIAMGLGMGAGQLYPTIVGFFVVCIIVIVLNKRNVRSAITQNLLIAVPTTHDQKTKIADQITDVIMKQANQVDLKRLKFNEDTVHLNFLVNVSSIKKLNTINEGLLAIDTGMDITFIDTQL